MVEAKTNSSGQKLEFAPYFFDTNQAVTVTVFILSRDEQKTERLT